jgi:hypothetical protein
MSGGVEEPKGPEVLVVDLTGEVSLSGQLPSIDLTEFEPPSGAGLLLWPLVLADDE